MFCQNLLKNQQIIYHLESFLNNLNTTVPISNFIMGRQAHAIYNLGCLMCFMLNGVEGWIKKKNKIR